MNPFLRGAGASSELAKRLAALMGGVKVEGDIRLEEEVEIQRVARDLAGLEALVLDDKPLNKTDPLYKRAKDIYLRRRAKFGSAEAMAGQVMGGRSERDELRDLTGL